MRMAKSFGNIILKKTKIKKKKDTLLLGHLSLIFSYDLIKVRFDRRQAHMQYSIKNVNFKTIIIPGL